MGNSVEVGAALSLGVIRVITATSRVLLSLTLLAGLGGAVVAHADPLNADSGGNAETALPWTAVGLPDGFTLVGANNNQDFTLPVPSGFAVTRLRGLIHAPMDFGPGFVEIDDSRGTVLGTVDLPAVVPNQAAVPFDVDISAAQVTASAVRLSFYVRQGFLPPDQRCGLGERVDISDLSAAFVGTEAAPTTVADFFPPVLQRVTIYAPIDADDAEQQAVLTVTSALARTYRAQPTAFSVVRQPRGSAPPPAPQLTRAIVVERGDAAITVVNPDRADVYLKLTGRGGQLSDQASLAVNQLQSLVQVPTARVDTAGSQSLPDADVVSFGDLGVTGESSVIRTSTLTAGVDRSALGGRVDGVQVHLLANYTPVAAMDSASVMVRVNGQSVHSSALDTSGRLDTTFDVPGQLLGQRLTFALDLAYTPRQLCSPMIAPMTFQLDPASTLTMRRGGAAAGGFAAVPSELSPELLVAMDGSSPAQLDYASRVLADVAQRTGTPLMPRVVNVKDAANATTGALIVANSATTEQTSLRPPVGGKNSSDVQVNLQDQLRADIDGGLGSLQVFADEPRNRTVVLVTTSGSWSLVDPLFGYIASLPDAWSSLTGNVLAAGPGAKVTNLAIGTDEPAAPASAEEGPGWLLWSAVGAAVLLVALGIIAALGIRRRSAARKT